MSPALSASKDEGSGKYQLDAFARFKSAAIEFSHHGVASTEEPSDETDNLDTEIQTIFRRKIAGLRLLPRRERAQARRAALEWLWFAMTDLREKRAHARYARYVLRRQQIPPPKPC